MTRQKVSTQWRQAAPAYARDVLSDLFFLSKDLSKDLVRTERIHQPNQNVPCLRCCGDPKGQMMKILHNGYWPMFLHWPVLLAMFTVWLHQLPLLSLCHSTYDCTGNWTHRSSMLYFALRYTISIHYSFLCCILVLLFSFYSATVCLQHCHSDRSRQHTQQTTDEKLKSRFKNRKCSCSISILCVGVHLPQKICCWLADMIVIY